jgi:hypothetical protein
LRKFDTVSPIIIPGNGDPPLTLCLTPAYLSAGGEIAVVRTHASCSVPSFNGLLFAPAASLNGGTAYSLATNWPESNTSANSEWRTVGREHVETLFAGVTYAFAMNVSNNSAAPHPSAGTCWCSVVVEVVPE